MFRASCRSYICAQCLAQALPKDPSYCAVAISGAKHVSKRCHSTLSPPPRKADDLATILPTHKSSPEEARLPIHQRLRLWAAQNKDVTQQVIPVDMALIGNLANTMSRTQTTGSAAMDQIGIVETTGTNPTSVTDATATEAGVSHIGSAAHNPGDLVELRQSASRVVHLAIYLGFFGGRNHFYTINGRWTMSTSISSYFTIPHFASLDELAPILDTIPQNASPDEYSRMLQDDEGPTRHAGAHLLHKMTSFREEAEATAKFNIGTLESAHKRLYSEDESNYLSLDQITNALLPEALKTAGQHSDHALYAVHLSILSKEIGFSCLNLCTDSRRADTLYEIFSRAHHDTIQRVVTLTRSYIDKLVEHQQGDVSDNELPKFPMGLFILNARKLVTKARRFRSWNPAGSSTCSTPVNMANFKWDSESQDIIAFLEWWASYDLFAAGSRYNAYGATILRALGLYWNVDFNQATAWTFLQEIGVILPWDLPTRYRVRLPGVQVVNYGGLSRKTPDGMSESMRPDVAAEARRLVTCNNVFCIDAASTTLLDDAISLEPTDKATEFWIHIHTADPASGIIPDSGLCKYMELVPQNIYLPGHFQAMLPDSISDEHAKDYQSSTISDMYSLRSHGPALTFSAKVNDEGDILDYKIEPTLLKNVIALEPGDVQRFCKEPASPPVNQKYNFSVGVKPEKGATKQRDMMTVESLDESSKADIETLHRLGRAMNSKWLANGAWPYFAPRPTVNVLFHQSVEDETAAADQFLPPDPHITVGLYANQSSALVTSCMLLAGQVAARWCFDRGIPIPYRRQVKRDSTAAALHFAKTKVYPRLQQGFEPRRVDWQHFKALTGGVEISSEPGPYLMLGLDMYAKATSPLRRFSDLLVHWQIHAALAHERRQQRRVDAQLDKLEDILPFTGQKLHEMLAMLELRERMANRMNQGVLDWIMIALDRAWRIEHTVPGNLRFTVTSCSSRGLLGQLDMYSLNAALDPDGLSGCCLVRDVRVDDVFEVEIVKIIVPSRRVLVKALRYLGQDHDAQVGALGAAL
ncbi:hypothetical protein CDD81_2261 [Ophiocordyceps australis]|uniref:RNB domain-containing protein n=1 Tax=Ophiocordyceps australis TaxID=1399860 RepID=A0A2C5YF34_9HYPO|nr:hypothetical protein CDD81_2261 [Ophiocordyceps australis]